MDRIRTHKRGDGAGDFSRFHWRLLSLFCWGCDKLHKLEVTPPDYSLRLSENKQLKKPFDRVWARAIGWFDANEVAIERIDERTGYIEGKLAAATGSLFMDCGTVAMRNIVSQPSFSQKRLSVCR